LFFLLKKNIILIRVWIITKNFFPDASEYPLIAISHSTRYNAEEHIEVGKVLRKYREEKGALLIFSASISHNMRDMVTVVRTGLKTKNEQVYRDFEEYVRKNALKLAGLEREQHIL
jgi:aromatic ring-opening dioxygenase catalytic subunit (LigB family)